MVSRVRPERYEEYAKGHADVWPEVTRANYGANIRNYVLYHKDGWLFSHFDYVGEDFEADMKKMAENPAVQKWWDLMRPMLDPLKTGEWWTEMKELFFQGVSPFQEK
jgi:L-rhamnose mutarotase